MPRRHRRVGPSRVVGSGRVKRSSSNCLFTVSAGILLGISASLLVVALLTESHLLSFSRQQLREQFRHQFMPQQPVTPTDGASELRQTVVQLDKLNRRRAWLASQWDAVESPSRLPGKSKARGKSVAASSNANAQLEQPAQEPLRVWRRQAGSAAAAMPAQEKHSVRPSPLGRRVSAPDADAPQAAPPPPPAPSPPLSRSPRLDRAEDAGALHSGRASTKKSKRRSLSMGPKEIIAAALEEVGLGGVELETMHLDFGEDDSRSDRSDHREENQAALRSQLQAQDAMADEDISEEEAMRIAEAALLPERSGTGVGALSAGRAIDDSKADALLDEAVQALSEEPFQRVDRIEFMNEQLRTSGEGPALGQSGRAGAGGASDRAQSEGDMAAGGGSVRAPPPTGFSLSLVTQTDTSRLEWLRECSRRWEGPLVAALFLRSNVTVEQAIGGRRFMPHVNLIPLQQDPTMDDSVYPINKLRNLAIRAVRTTHYIVLDVDLWPSKDTLSAVLAAPAHLLGQKDAALVVPAFQYEHVAESNFEQLFGNVPRSLSELRGCIAEGQCATFYAHSSPETHSSTPYERCKQVPAKHNVVGLWTTRENSHVTGSSCFYRVGTHVSARGDAQAQLGAGRWTTALGSEPIHIACIKSQRYEPYVVLPNLPTTPIYSEAFTGYGKNKIELVTHLRFAGFNFHALPGAFVVHMPHPKSAPKLSWEAGPHRRRMDTLFRRFVAQLISYYKKPRTPSCTPGRLL